MSIKVLVVDDSGFFRRRISEILNADPFLEVVDTASNGLEAVRKVIQLQPDVVIMDIEMPVLDGISAVRRIMATRPTPVLMFSSLTYESAQATLDALDAGAMDFLPKKFEDIASNFADVKKLLCSRVKVIARKNGKPPVLKSPGSVKDMRTCRSTPADYGHAKAVSGPYEMILIGTSTGGPVALQKILAQLPADFTIPILLIQHMPATFTTAFAQRLNQLCQIKVKEAADGDLVSRGTAYLAPGGKQMEINRHSAKKILRVRDSGVDETYRPSIDLTFQSVAQGISGRVLAVVLTGMGSDGREGARSLKASGATVWAQNEQSCVVYGMPMSVVEAGLADSVLSLHDIGHHLAQQI